MPDQYVPNAGPIGGMSVPIRSWNRIRNHGDAVSFDILDKVFGATPYQVTPDKPHVLAVGSITFLATPHSTIWGSGVLNKKTWLPDLKSGQISALRGRLSADHLIQSGTHLPDIPFGDPGIFVDRLVDTRDVVKNRRFRVAVIPHHGTVHHPFFTKATEMADVRVVDILQNSITPLIEIAQSDVVISQSLHGLIYAESLGKPSLWVSSSTEDDWTFKFKDWFSTTYNPQLRPASLDEPFESLVGQAEFRFSRINKDELAAAFPSNLCVARTDEFLPYARCRQFSSVTLFHASELFEAFALRQSEGQVDEDIASPFSTEIRKLCNETFRSWAERPYSLLLRRGTAVVPTSAELAAITHDLDRLVSFDGAYIVRRAENGRTEHGSSIGAGVVRYAGLKIAGDAIVLRPTFDRLTQNFAVYGIDV